MKLFNILFLLSFLSSSESVAQRSSDVIYPIVSRAIATCPAQCRSINGVANGCVTRCIKSNIDGHLANYQLIQLLIAEFCIKQKNKSMCDDMQMCINGGVDGHGPHWVFISVCMQIAISKAKKPKKEAYNGY